MNAEVLASDLIYPIYRGLSEDFKMKYRVDSWSVLESHIRFAANTPLLSKFYDKLTRTLPIKIKANHKDQVLGVIASRQDNEALRLLRQETSYIILLCRAMHEQHKETLKNTHK